jgi:hypothetical protein
MRSTTLLFLSVVFAASFIGGTASSIAAETPCKGLKTDACTGNTTCSWVKPYKTKKGKEIAGFCRKKPSRQSSSTGASSQG